MDILKKLLKYIGVDRAVAYVLAGKGISFIVQPITLYLIATYFTGIEQGYYYTFASILTASIFIELGLSMVLTQYASHEYASLRWEDYGRLAGDEISLSRLISLIQKSIKWYGIISIVFVVSFIPGGIAFLSSNSGASEINFILPWIILVVFNSFTLFLSPVLAILEGCGRIADVHKMKLYQIGFGAIIVWLVIITRGNLFAASSLAVTNFIVSAIWITTRYKGLLKQAFVENTIIDRQQISWRRELFPMQWKIAISWISGYLTFQLYTPLLFRYQNATIAGQMGMTLYISNIALGIGIVWLLTKFPLYGAIIKKKNFNLLDQIAKNNTIYSIFFTAIISIICLIIVYMIKLFYPHIGNRILSLGAVAALLISNLVTILTTSMAGYLRAHKSEPFMISSIIFALVMTLVIWIDAKYYSADIMAYSIACINLIIILPFNTYIFKNKRNAWHKRPIIEQTK